jgi:hypothetical protein
MPHHSKIINCISSNDIVTQLQFCETIKNITLERLAIWTLLWCYLMFISLHKMLGICTCNLYVCRLIGNAIRSSGCTA